MEIVAVILVIVFVLISSAGKKTNGKNAANGKGAAQQAVRAAQTPVSRMGIREREARMAELRQKRAARQAAKPVAQPAQPTVKAPEEAAEEDFEVSLNEMRELLNIAGASTAGGVDEEGCVGGSMEHTHEEGESREEHSRHMAAMQARDAGEAAQEARPTIDAATLRRAVVMSEVLGRPRALKGARR